MVTPNNRHDADRQPDDALLRKARDAVEKERLAGGGNARVRMEQGAAASLIQRVVDACTAFFRLLSKPFLGLDALFRGRAMRRLGRGLAWSAFERDHGAFRLDNDGKRVFSRRRLTKIGAAVVATATLCYIAIAAAYFHGTKFEELVYTTGKQEIEVGEVYQFTGCTVLPCSTEADNGKYYKIETSLFLPTLLYPEQDVYAHIPQQNAACYVKGYGIYATCDGCTSTRSGTSRPTTFPAGLTTSRNCRCRAFPDSQDREHFVSQAAAGTLRAMSALIRLLPLFRMVTLVLLMAGVLVKPVLAFAGELHEAEHAASAGGDMHDHDDGDVAPDPVDPLDGNNPWHALMHFGHCCGQTPALLPPVPTGSILATANVLPALWSVAFKPAAQPVALRPPITT